MTKQTVFTLLAASLMTVGCSGKGDQQAATTSPAPESPAVASAPVYDATATPQEAYELTVKAALDLQASARDLNHEWSRTEEMLQTAGGLAGEGDFAAALKLAETARQQYALAIQQARSEAGNWQARALN